MADDTEPTDQNEQTSRSPRPTDRTHSKEPRKKKLKHWLLHVFVILLISSVFEKVLNEQNVHKANEAFISGVEHANPFTFLSAWYEYVQYEGPEDNWRHDWQLKMLQGKTLKDMMDDKGGLSSPKIVTRAFPAFGYAFGKTSEGGPVAIITVALALLTGLAIGIGLMSDTKSDTGCAPLIWGPTVLGPVAIWLLLLILKGAGYALNFLLAGPEMATGVSLMAATGAQVSGAFLHAVVKEREHVFVNKLTHFLTGE